MIPISKQLKFMLKNLVIEELKKMKIYPLADSFNGTQRHNNPGRLWAPLHVKSDSKTMNADKSTSAKVQKLVHDVLQPTVENNSSSFFFSSCAWTCCFFNHGDSQGSSSLAFSTAILLLKKSMSPNSQPL